MTLGRLPFVFLALAVAAAMLVPAARASSFGVPPGPGLNPSGYFILTSQDAVDPIVSDALGDVAHFTVLYIEVATPGISVDLYDPGLYNPALGAGQLDLNLGSPPAAPAQIRYRLFGPDPGTGFPDTLLAEQTFGADTAATDKQVVNLYSDNRADPGLYHLTVHVLDGLPLEQDVAVFGVSVPGRDAYTLNLTAGEATAGGAIVTEPLRAFPLVTQPTAATDAFGAVCGLQFVTFDLEASPNGAEPPVVELTTRKGFTYPRDGASGDARWWFTDVGGINPGSLDSSDHGVWSWDFTQLPRPEDCFGNLTPPQDFNLFSLQVLNYGAPMRDFSNWKDLPDAPPFFVFNPDGPRRIYLPDDSGNAPLKEVLDQSATIISGFPVVALGETSTIEVAVTLMNPASYDLTGVAGETFIAPSATISDPVLVSSTGGLTAVIDPGNPRHITFTGDVTSGSTGEIRYTVVITPDALGRFFLTGDGVDFTSPSAPTRATYQTPFTLPGSLEIPQETQGPICALEYEVILPPCIAQADLVASATRTCPGTNVTLDGTASQVLSCPGGVAVYQWKVNGAVLLPFPAADTIDVTPFFNDTYELEVACSTDPATCIDSASITFDLYPAPLVDVGADRTICVTASTTLDALVTDGTPPYSNGTWTTSPAGQPGDGSTALTLDVAPTVTTTYTFTTDDAQGCVGTDSVVVTVSAPSPGITPASPSVCPGSSTTITADSGYVTYSWSSVEDPSVNGLSTEAISVGFVGATYTVTVTDAAGCSGSSSVALTASADPLPPAMNWSLRVAKSGPADLLFTWQDLPDPAGAYELVSLDCDGDLDGLCDVDPTDAALRAAAPGVNVAVGAQSSTEAGGQTRPSWLVFYKVRALSPCSQSPGPFGDVP